jgi:mannose-6-phosphate isomerase-like protein (cupin superfamily)
VDGKDFPMKPGDSVIIARGVPHRFVGASERAAVTFNVYSPPAY